MAKPHSPDNKALAKDCRDTKIDRVYIGSCTGGKTEDFAAAARILQNKKAREIPYTNVFHRRDYFCEVTYREASCFDRVIGTIFSHHGTEVLRQSTQLEEPTAIISG